MVITLVTDQFYQSNHGTSVSAQRLYKGLVAAGHVVRVLTIDDGTHTPYALQERSFGNLCDKIIHSQGMQFANPDEDIIREAIERSDIVHVYMPFKLGYRTVELCREMDVPCTAAFHVAPENITSTLRMKNARLLNFVIWRIWFLSTYQYVGHIHCPSSVVARQLEKRCYNGNIHIISNGYDDIFQKHEEAKPILFQDKFVIVATGRLSREKRFDLIMKAVRQSKYRDRIVLIIGGKGPLKNKLMRMAKKLPNYPVFIGHYNREQQLSFLNFADLYVHPADIEVEGMTCIEAIACGCVPIVSDSAKSATSQFAVHKNSVFHSGDYCDLADKIDWWIEHPNELKNNSQAVAEHAQNFTIERSMSLYIAMFEKAIADWKQAHEIQANGYDEFMEDSATKIRVL